MNVSLVEFSDAVAEVIATAAPSVVGVGRAGSGVVVADGLVVTNAHNLPRRGRGFVCGRADGRGHCGRCRHGR